MSATARLPLGFDAMNHRLRVVSVCFAPFAILSSGNVGADLPRFVDRTADLALTIPGDKAAWGDVNDDDWPDLLAGSRLFINREGMRFDASEIPGLGSGFIADLDNDGDGDIFAFSPIAAWRNMGFDDAGVPRFQAVLMPQLPETLSRGAAVADYNDDGILDAYVGGYETWEPQCTFPDLLLLGDGSCGFTLAQVIPGFRARGITACDFDIDGDSDVYVSNYRLQPNLLLVNSGSGALIDEAGPRNARATSEGFEGGHSIGACWGDFDNDGLFDLFAGNFAHVDHRGDQPKSRFLRNRGPADAYTFEDKGECGIRYQESYASPATADIDNDARLDLYFTTVYAKASFNLENHAVLYRQSQTPWTFSDITTDAGLANLPPTYQAAWADYDRDGRIDLVTGGRLFRNETESSSRAVSIRLINLPGRAGGRDAVGASVRLTRFDGQQIVRQIEIGTGEGNANSPILHFGLGQSPADHPPAIEIRWPGDTGWVPLTAKTIGSQMRIGR